VSVPDSDRFSPGKDPVLVAKEAGWALGPVWMGEDNLVFTEIRSPYRLAVTAALPRPQFDVK